MVWVCEGESEDERGQTYGLPFSSAGRDLELRGAGALCAQRRWVWSVALYFRPGAPQNFLPSRDLILPTRTLLLQNTEKVSSHWKGGNQAPLLCTLS